MQPAPAAPARDQRRRVTRPPRTYAAWRAARDFRRRLRSHFVTSSPITRKRRCATCRSGGSCCSHARGGGERLVCPSSYDARQDFPHLDEIARGSSRITPQGAARHLSAVLHAGVTSALSPARSSARSSRPRTCGAAARTGQPHPDRPRKRHAPSSSTDRSDALITGRQRSRTASRRLLLAALISARDADAGETSFRILATRASRSCSSCSPRGGAVALILTVFFEDTDPSTTQHVGRSSRIVGSTACA